jgi:hypothetical protein
MRRDPGAPRLARAELETDDAQALPPADCPHLARALDVASHLERGARRAARIPASDALEGAPDLVPGRAAFRASRVRSQVAAQEAQPIGPRHAERMAVELRQEHPASVAERRADVAALEVDQAEAPVVEHEEVVRREVVLVDPGVVEPPSQGAEALEQRPPPRALEAWIGQDDPQVPTGSLGDHREAPAQGSGPALLADRDRPRRLQAARADRPPDRGLAPCLGRTQPIAQARQAGRQGEDLHVECGLARGCLDPVEAFAADAAASHTAGTLEHPVGVGHQRLEDPGRLPLQPPPQLTRPRRVDRRHARRRLAQCNCDP